MPTRRGLLAGISTFAVTAAAGVRKVWAVPPENPPFDPASFTEHPIWEAPEGERIMFMAKFGDSLIVSTERRTIELVPKG